MGQRPRGGARNSAEERGRSVLSRWILRAAPTAAAARALRRIAALFAFLAAAGGAATALASDALAGGVAGAAIAVGAIALAAGAATLFCRLGDLGGQRARDAYAQSVADALFEGGEPRPFTLYLRPFASTDLFDARAFAALPLGVGAEAGGMFVAPRERFEMEGSLARAIDDVAPLVTLGLPLEHIGAGRIPVAEGRWRALVGKLIERADMILLLPSSRDGTLWEVEQILESRAVGKTVVVDPPKSLATGVGYDHEAEWEHLRAVFAERGFALQPNHHDGALVFFGDDRAPRDQIRLDIANVSRLRRFLRRAAAARGAAARAQ